MKLNAKEMNFDAVAPAEIDETIQVLIFKMFDLISEAPRPGFIVDLMECYDISPTSVMADHVSRMDEHSGAAFYADVAILVREKRDEKKPDTRENSAGTAPDTVGYAIERMRRELPPGCCFVINVQDQEYDIELYDAEGADMAVGYGIDLGYGSDDLAREIICALSVAVDGADESDL